MKMRFVALSFILAIIPVVGQAQTGQYVGVGVGRASVPFVDDAASADGTITLAGTESSPLAFSLYAGIWITENIGVEAGYMRSLNADVKINNQSTGLNYHVSTTYAAAIARVAPDSAFTPFGKVGFHKFKVAATTPTGAEVSASDDGTKFMLGAGADIAIAESWNIRAEYAYLPYDDGKAHGFFVGVNRTF